MGKIEQRSKEDQRKNTERRKSNILNYELLNFDRPDSRSEPNRRSGIEQRVT